MKQHQQQVLKTNWTLKHPSSVSQIQSHLWKESTWPTRHCHANKKNYIRRFIESSSIKTENNFLVKLSVQMPNDIGVFQLQILKLIVTTCCWYRICIESMAKKLFSVFILELSISLCRLPSWLWMNPACPLGVVPADNLQIGCYHLFLTPFAILYDYLLLHKLHRCGPESFAKKHFSIFIYKYIKLLSKSIILGSFSSTLILKIPQRKYFVMSNT